MKRKKLYMISTLITTIFIIIIGYSLFSPDELKPEIIISDKPIYLNYENHQIEYTNPLPDAVITYKSSNKLIKVDENGLVRPIAAGTADISVVIKHKWKKYKLKTTITVYDPYIFINNEISEIILTDSYLFQAETVGLKKPDIIWSVSDDSLGIINPATGRFYAKNIGRVNIIARDKSSGVTSICHVNIIEIPFEIADKKEEYWCGVSYKLRTRGTDAPILWSVSDNEIATIDENGIFFAKRIGEVTIIAKDMNTEKEISISVKTKDVEESPAEIFDIIIYNNNNNIIEACIMGLKDKSYSEIKIPDQFNGVDIVAINSGVFYNQPQLKTVIIPSKIKLVGNSFYKCDNLESIVILDKSPHDYNTRYVNPHFRFEQAEACKNLIEFVMPYECSILLDEYCLYNNVSLKSVTLPENIYGIGSSMFGAFNNKDFFMEELEVIFPSTVTDLELFHCYFGYVVDLKVVIPATVTNINLYDITDYTHIVIYTPKNSAVEKYAIDNNIPYVNY